MTVEEIMNTRIQLDQELKTALSTMNQKDTVFEIRKKIRQLQADCPHYSVQYSSLKVDKTCPFCGVTLKD